MKLRSTLLLLLMPTLSLSAYAAEPASCAPKSYEMALKYQQQSAEVMALQLQTYRLATERLAEKIAKPSPATKPAVVLDLDETVLDNSALLVRDMQQCHDFTTWDTWGEWEKTGRPKLIPGAKAFLDFANQHQISIYYVSDRSQDNKSYTLATLKALGLPQISANSVLLDTGSKVQRREAIEKTHQIIMLFGDSLADFAGVFKNHKPATEQRQLVQDQQKHFGDDWFILPNASYGSWSTATLNSWNSG